jgi:alkylation response protein AidB-like acyl-CoA dehydrogenase
LAEDPTARCAFAKARATWRLCKAAVTSQAEEAWRAAVAGRPLTAEARAEMTAVCALGVAELSAVAGDLAALAGMTSIDQDSEVGRAWRDLLALGAHFSVSPRQLAGAGASLLEAAASG